MKTIPFRIWLDFERIKCFYFLVSTQICALSLFYVIYLTKTNPTKIFSHLIWNAAAYSLKVCILFLVFLVAVVVACRFLLDFNGFSVSNRNDNNTVDWKARTNDTVDPAHAMKLRAPIENIWTQATSCVVAAAAACVHLSFTLFCHVFWRCLFLILIFLSFASAVCVVSLVEMTKNCLMKWKDTSK